MANKSLFRISIDSTLLKQEDNNWNRDITLCAFVIDAKLKEYTIGVYFIFCVQNAAKDHWKEKDMPQFQSSN